MIDDDMTTKTLEELQQIVAEGEARKEEMERQFKILVSRSLVRIEDMVKDVITKLDKA